jgi:hypothetical protein
MTHYLSEKSIQKYNNDLSMVKYLFGESFVSSKITFFERNHGEMEMTIPIVNKIIGPPITSCVIPPYLIIQYLKFTFTFVYCSKQSTINKITLYCDGCTLHFYLNGVVLDGDDHRNAHSFCPLPETIELIEKNSHLYYSNRINNYLKSIDDNFIDKYMTLIRYCFDLMGG